MKKVSLKKHLPFAALPVAIAVTLGMTAPAVAQTVSRPAGFYQQTIGYLNLTALKDGEVYLPRSDVANITEKQRDKLLAKSKTVETKDGLSTSVNALLIGKGNEWLLVDTGTANCFASFNKTLGHVPENLRAAGTKPQQISHILLTHGHPDHICGLLDASGKAVYPNATVWINRDELAYWQNDAEKNKAPNEIRFLWDQARAALTPYRQAGRLRTFTSGEKLPFGAQAIATPGHTAGHTSFLFETGQQPLLVWGDIIHFPAIQLAVPKAGYQADQNGAYSQASRNAMLAQAAKNQWWVAGAHMPFPGIGRVEKNSGIKGGYRWISAKP